MVNKTEKTQDQRPGRYIGQTLNQVRHGQGKYVYDNTFFAYDGTWVEGLKHGKGTFSMRDGGYYKGDFNNGEITGKGERFWSNGSIYAGDFDRGELSGFGGMKYADGRRYNGQWCDNKYEGHGTFHSGVGDIYTGHFHIHKRHGDGEQVWADGKSYVGGWVADKPHGHGTMTYADKSVYEGQFYHGIRKGQGTYTHVTGITYSGLWIQDEIPPEEFSAGIAFVGLTEIEICHGESFSIELAVLHTNANVMEGDTGRTLDVQVGLLSPLPGDKTAKLRSETSEGSFETPFGVVRLASLAEVTKKDTRWDEYEETQETTSSRQQEQRPASRSGYDYIKLPTPAPTSSKRNTLCGHASWANVVIPAHEMMEAVESEEDEADLAEDTKPKAKKKGKNSPATSRKDRSATPDDKEKWKKEGPRAERDKDLLNYAAPGTYVIKVADVTEPKFFERTLEPIYMKVNVLRVKKASTKYLIPKATKSPNPTPAPSKKSEK